MPGRELIDTGIADGTIDTVVVAFPDMYGRPVGKRVTADFFTSHVAEHGIEACDYLLAVDVDMTPLPGYRFTNWDTGYGDFVCRPDYATARRIPWLDGTAMVICDLTDEAGTPVDVSPRRILRHQLARASERGLRVCSATELEFFLFKDSYEEAAAKAWQDLTPHTSTIEDYQLLQTAREEYVLRRIRNEMCEADIPVEFSKGEAGRGQHEVNVTYDEALVTADRHLVFKNGIKEIAAQEGRAATFMAKWTMDDVGSSCHVHTSLWDAESGEALMADAAAPEPAVDGRAPLPRWPAARGARAGLVLAAPDAQLVPPLRARELGTDRSGLGRGQPDLRLPRRRARGGPAGREPDPRRRRQPVPGAGRGHRGRALRHRPRARAGRPLPASTPTRPPTSRGSRRRWSRRSRSCAASAVALEAFGPTCTTTCSTRPSRNGPRPTVT